MNISQNINKLLFALKQKGQIYRINSFQFYSEKNEKYCTKYQILKRKLIPVDIDLELDEDEEQEYKERYDVKEECYSKIDVLKYLIEEHRKGSEADGE